MNTNTKAAMPNALISPAELKVLLNANTASVKLLDASYALPNSGLNPKETWAKERIENAAFFDIDAAADRTSPLPHMLPTPEAFADYVAALGISNGNFVVVYDQTGIAMAASRAWWMFRVFGHDNVKVLDGGLPRWKKDGFPVSTEPFTPPQAGSFKAGFRPALVKSRQDVLKAIDDKNTTIIDARPPDRFLGKAPEPRPNLRSGHIPNSRNVPTNTLIDTEKMGVKSTNELLSLFSSVKNSPAIIASCGSGATACALALGLFQLGRNDVAVYDGSWAEWGQPALNLPIETDAR